MADKRLVVTDVDVNSADYGSLLAVAPGTATALPIPAFRMGTVTPAAGTMAGEGFINTVSRTAAVWDGTNWVPIVPGALIIYPTDVDVIADVNQATGSYATSQQSGNLFVKSATVWRQIGVRNYNTVANLLADNAPEGSLGVALDEETFWVVHGGVWHCHSRRPVADVVALGSWVNPPEGSTAIEQAEELRYHFHSGHWVPESIWIKTEADILASVDRLDGQMAVSSDTGHVYVWHSGRWMSSQIQHYITEQALLGDSPNDGIIAWGDDNGLVYVRYNGNWRRVNEPTVVVGPNQPGTPAVGDLYFNTVNMDASIYDGAVWQPLAASVRVPSVKRQPPGTGDLWLDRSAATPTVNVYDGTSWNPMGGSPVGTIIMYPNTTPPPGYLLCDGSAIDQNAYPQLYALFSHVGGALRGHLPDLTDQFIRGATSSNDCTGHIKHEDTTRRPRHHSLTGSTNWSGVHWHTLFKLRWHGLNDGGGYSDLEYQNQNNSSQDTSAPRTNDSGNHVHNITVTGGGDPETAPKHVRLAYVIKHD